MATRMQQRRGTAAQWTSANPILAAGEIGFESDSSKFKIGDGVNHWDDLIYYASAADLASLIDGAPDLLNTLNELAQAIGDDASFASTVETAITTATEAAAEYTDDSTSGHNSTTVGVHGIADTAELSTKTYANDAVGSALLTHNSDTTSVHGIADTSLLATLTNASDAAASAVSTHNSDTTSVHGISDTANLVYTSDLSTHVSDTTNIHGITDTADLATKSYADTAETDAITAAGTAADSKIATAVAALTKSSVGLANVDNTSDANKPVSTATQTALDLKADKATPTFTGTVTASNDLIVDGNLTVNGTTFNASSTSITIEDNLVQIAHQNAVNTVDLGLVVGYNDGAAKHAGIVRDVSDDKWRLFKGVTSEPTTTVNFGQGSLDNLAVAALEATTVTPSSGIVFSDGTQTRVGVPSITTFATAISSSATLAAGEADKFVPLTGAVTITLPATGYSTGQSIDFYQESGTGAQFASTNSVVGTPGLKFRTTNSVATAMKTASGWLVFGDLSA